MGVVGLSLYSGGSLIKNIRRTGFKEGSLQTIGGLSPLRTQPKIYSTPKLDEVKFEAASLKFTDKTGTTNRLMLAKAKHEPVSLVSIQQLKLLPSGKVSGASENLILQKATLIKPSGLIESGEGVSISHSMLKGLSAKSVGLNYQNILADLTKFRGGASKTLTQERVNLFWGHKTKMARLTFGSSKFQVGKGAGAEVSTGSFTSRFAFGKSKRKFETKIENVKLDLKTGEVMPVDFIRNPMAKVKVKPTISGKEIDLNKMMSSLMGKGGRVISGKKSTALKSTFKQDESLQLQLQGIQSGLSLKTPSVKTSVQKGLIVSQPKTSSKPLKSLVKTEAQIFQTPVIKTTQKEFVLIKQKPLQRTKQKLRLATKQKSIQKQIQISKAKQIQKSSSALKQIQLLKTQQKTQQIQKQILGTSTPTWFTPTPVKIPPVIRGIGFPPWKLGGSTRQPRQQKGFEVFGRRFGKWKPLGMGTEKEVFSVGKKFMRETLGASIKVPKSTRLKLPGYRTKKTKEGVLFIEPKRKRLSTKLETKEIQFFKAKSPKKKRRKKNPLEF